ncbi:hypothetical protein [Nocardia veterana]|uniref:Uncharacterized protein n=1 Tax=Nocardia veterana TaxID=132249 RepID=A0A7X6RJH6_9NOCA|nr:hypothetical protein [Nocardia veterana]NKY88206.1 hypothetical protein [Nocardia veterana]
MSDLKLVRISGGAAIESGSSVAFGTPPAKDDRVEYGGAVRRAALGIDETGSPIIFEYKRSRDENVLTKASSTWIGSSTIKGAETADFYSIGRWVAKVAGSF